MLCCLSCRVFNIFGCYVACHVVYLTYLDVMLLVMLYLFDIFDIFGCYVACHVVYLTHLDVMWIVILCI